MNIRLTWVLFEGINVWFMFLTWKKLWGWEQACWGIEGGGLKNFNEFVCFGGCLRSWFFYGYIQSLQGSRFLSGVERCQGVWWTCFFYYLLNKVNVFFWEMLLNNFLFLSLCRDIVCYCLICCCLVFGWGFYKRLYFLVNCCFTPPIWLITWMSFLNELGRLVGFLFLIVGCMWFFGWCWSTCSFLFCCDIILITQSWYFSRFSILAFIWLICFYGEASSSFVLWAFICSFHIMTKAFFWEGYFRLEKSGFDSFDVQAS